MSRRARGTGSVSLHRPSGRWMWRFRGKSGYTDTREEAEDVLEVLLEDAEGRAPETLVTWIDRWLDDCELSGRMRYVDKERDRARAYVKTYPLFHKRSLKRLSRPDLHQWIRWLEQRDGRRGKLSKNTIGNAKALVHGAFEAAINQGLVTSNPAAGVRVVGGKNKRPHDWLRPHEVESVLALELEPRQRAIISVAIFAGLSPKEIWHLEWSSVDLKAKTLLVRGEVKRESRVRELPLIKGTAEALSAWKAEQLRQRRVASQRPRAKGQVIRISPLVFPNSLGKPHDLSADPAKWRRKVQRRHGKTYTRVSIPERAGIDRHVVFRDLRHTFASNLVSGSWGTPIDLHRLAYLMGHGDVSATKIYAHLHPDGPIAAMRALDGSV